MCFNSSAVAVQRSILHWHVYAVNIVINNSEIVMVYTHTIEIHQYVITICLNKI